ncbi:MAG: hypothetical protein AAGG01_06120, partial [Planctomycetota bacterium]
MSQSIILPAALSLLAPAGLAQSVLINHNSQNGGNQVAAFDAFDGSLQSPSFINLREDQGVINRGIQTVFTRGEWWITDNVLEEVAAWSLFGADYLRQELGGNGDLEGGVQAFGSSWVCAQEAPFAPGKILEIRPNSVIEHSIYLDSPAAICALGNELIITGGNDVVRFDPSTGTVISTIFTSFSQQGFNQPIVRPSTGRLLIARAASKNDIVEMDIGGNIVAEFDVGAALGLFAPRACFELGNGNFLISWGAGVSIVDPSLTFVEHVLDDITPWYMTPTSNVSVGQNYCGPIVPNSSGRAGQVSATGTTQAAIGELRLSAFNLPSLSAGFFIGSQTQGFVTTPGGSTGNLCLGGTIGRFSQQVQNTGGVDYIAITVDTTAIPQPNTTLPIVAGQTWNFQA